MVINHDQIDDKLSNHCPGIGVSAARNRGGVRGPVSVPADVD
jgi:hypothetical protein